MPVIGFLGSTSSELWRPYVAAFRAGLSEKGYVDGRNVTIEFRWAGGNTTTFPRREQSESPCQGLPLS
jgi:putative ABC transport system substrate-binding protein